MSQFYLFSTDVAPEVDPTGLSPAVLVSFPADPIFGQYDESGGSRGRGSRFQTLGGAVWQDFGVFVQDGQILISEENIWMEPGVSFVPDMDAAFAAVDTVYWFSDGDQVRKVRFARPDGWVRRKNLLFSVKEGLSVYSYAVVLDVVEDELKKDFGMFLKCVTS